MNCDREHYGETSLHMLPMAPLAKRYRNQLILLLSSRSKPLVFNFKISTCSQKI